MKSVKDSIEELEDVLEIYGKESDIRAIKDTILIFDKNGYFVTDIVI